LTAEIKPRRFLFLIKIPAVLSAQRRLSDQRIAAKDSRALELLLDTHDEQSKYKFDFALERERKTVQECTR
jgi:hypothetical protein